MLLGLRAVGWRMLDNCSTPKRQPPPPFHPRCPVDVDACLTSVRRGCRPSLCLIKASANPLARVNQEAGNLSESSNHLAWQSAHSLCHFSTAPEWLSRSSKRGFVAIHDYTVGTQKWATGSYCSQQAFDLDHTELLPHKGAGSCKMERTTEQKQQMACQIVISS